MVYITKEKSVFAAANKTDASEDPLQHPDHLREIEERKRRMYNKFKHRDIDRNKVESDSEGSFLAVQVCSFDGRWGGDHLNFHILFFAFSLALDIHCYGYIPLLYIHM